MEQGCTTLLVDEDTCATNFMIRDLRMQMCVQGRRRVRVPVLVVY